MSVAICEIAIAWPLDVSSNMKLPFWPLSASYIHICIVIDLAIKLIYCLKDEGYICLWVSMTTLNSEMFILSSDNVEWGYICLLVSMTTLNSEEITLSSASVEWGVRYICHWVSMTTLNSEDDHSVLDNVEWGGISAFECQWQHWTAKRSLCPLLVLTRWGLSGIVSALECQWQHWISKEITLSSASVD